jgi:hypothetical protein
MSDEELKAELERLRKGSSLDLRNGALSCDPV